jgi:CrcB protein
VSEPTPHPVDPDVDLHVPADRRELRGHPWAVLGVISAGGVLGAEARYGWQRAVPHPPGGFDWATFGVNVSGCLLIGVLMALITELWPGQRLLRPFLGVGVLGGFTTFSAYAVDIEQTVAAGAAPTALAYLGGTLVAALCAVWLGATTAGGALRAARRRGGRPAPASEDAARC